MNKFASLRAEIRSITDNAGKLLLAGEIYAQLTRRGVTIATLGVTIIQMVEAQQLTKTPITKIRARGTQSKFAYGSGPTPVNTTKEYRPERARLKGFRELAREADARERSA